MARPIKNNADYFSHDRDMRNDLKVRYIRSKHGITGYGVYVMMLEYLAGCDFFESEFDKFIKMNLAGDMGISIEVLEGILEDCIEVKLFVRGGGKIWSEGLKKRLALMLEYRRKDAERKEGKKKSFSNGNTQENNDFQSENEVIQEENNDFQSESTQSKVKEKKVNNTLTGITENSPEFLVLEFLKKEIGVADFREDEKIQKIKAQEIYDLKQKVGELEFRRRLEALKSDRLKLQNCNSIGFLYGELKSARIEPLPPTPIAGNAGVTQPIPKMNTPVFNPYLADVEVERDPEESARVKAKLEAQVEKLKARGILSHRPNILTPHA